MQPSLFAVIAFTIALLLRVYPIHINRRIRIALISFVFVTTYLIQSQPLESTPYSSDSILGSSFNNTSYASHKIVHAQKYAQASDASIVVFYNLFIPYGDGVTNAINVIKDQISQVSYALYNLEQVHNNNFEKEKSKGILYYNLIGNNDAYPQSKMHELCTSLHPRLQCIQLQHYNNATESVTLTDLYDYCHSPHIMMQQNSSLTTTTRVAYLHSKGSFHDHGKQTPWRRELTNSSLHTKCLHPPNEECDVCGAQYYIMFASMFPGNMWTATCSYIQKLLPPIVNGEYWTRKESAIKQFLLLQSEGILKNTLGWHQDVFYGLDRYIWEHWIGSHPTLVPCEMHTPAIGFWDMVEGRVTPQHYEWGMGPRRTMIFDIPNKRKDWLSKNNTINFRQFYYLAGNMIKWVTLYDMVPPQDSWVWNTYPAGMIWKEYVAKHGTNSISALIDESRNEQSVFHSAFDARDSSATTTIHSFDEHDVSQPNPPIVVFYQILFPTDNKSKEKALETVKAQFDILSMGQYDNVTNTFDQHQKILLNYIISGSTSQEIDFVSNLCNKYSDRIICRQLGVYDNEFVSGETLAQVHKYCSARPSMAVVYITNHLVGLGIGQNDIYDVTKINATTLAVTSQMCYSSSEQDDASCNVCGTEFYPLPFLHFTGNMFSTSCEYVKKLLPPPEFEKEMHDNAGDVFLAHLRTQFTSELVKFTPQILGMHQHSIEHWIGSHPDLKPCDVGPMKTSSDYDENTIIDDMKRYTLAVAPRRGSAPPGFLNDDKELKFRSKREVAFREYYYLAGNVFRWHILYDRVPSSDSWVWKWFPDGALWESVAKFHGAYAVNEIAKQLSSDTSGMEQFWVE